MIARSCHTRNIHTSADHYDNMVRYGIVLIWIANLQLIRAASRIMMLLVSAQHVRQNSMRRVFFVFLRIAYCRLLCRVQLFTFTNELFQRWHNVNIKGEIYSKCINKHTFPLAWCGYQSIVPSHFIPSNFNNQLFIVGMMSRTYCYRLGWTRHVLGCLHASPFGSQQC